jgi:hypothetical protein
LCVVVRRGEVDEQGPDGGREWCEGHVGCCCWLHRCCCCLN